MAETKAGTNEIRMSCLSRTSPRSDAPDPPQPPPEPEDRPKGFSTCLPASIRQTCRNHLKTDGGNPQRFIQIEIRSLVLV